MIAVKGGYAVMKFTNSVLQQMKTDQL